MFYVLASQQIPLHIELQNSVGEKLLSEKIHGSEGFDISSFATGHYICTVTDLLSKEVMKRKLTIVR